MTDAEEKLIRIGNALAHSIGHRTHCPKVSQSIPCTCRASHEQAEALDDWYQLVRELGTQNSDEKSS